MNEGAARLQLMMGAALISTSAVWVKWAAVGPTQSAFYRMLIGGAVLLAWVLWRRQPLPRLPKLWLALLAAALCFAADLALWHRSIIAVGAGLSTLLASFQVFVLAAIGYFFLRERLQPGFYLGLLLAMAGLWFLVGLDWHTLPSLVRNGVWLGLATAFCYAGYVLCLRQAARHASGSSPESQLAWSSLLCAALLALLIWAEGGSFAVPDLKSWSSLLAYGCIAQVLGWLLIARAIPSLAASTVGFLLLAQPALAYVWDALLFSAGLTAWDYLGLALCLVGLYFGVLGRSVPGRVSKSAP